MVRSDPLTGSGETYTDVMEAEQKNNSIGYSLSVLLIWKSHSWLFVTGCPSASISQPWSIYKLRFWFCFHRLLKHQNLLCLMASLFNELNSIVNPYKRSYRMNYPWVNFNNQGWMGTRARKLKGKAKDSEKLLEHIFKHISSVFSIKSDSRNFFTTEW